MSFKSQEQLNTFLFNAILQRAADKLGDDFKLDEVSPLMMNELKSAADDLTEVLWPELSKRNCQCEDAGLCCVSCGEEA